MQTQQGLNGKQKRMAKGRKELIQVLATEYELPLKEVSKITSTQFRLIAETMAEGKYESVRCPYLGVFRVKPGRLKNQKKRMDAKRKTTKPR